MLGIAVVSSARPKRSRAVVGPIRRQVEKWPRLHAIIGQRVGKAIGTIGQVERLLLRHIEQAGTADSAVDREPAERLERLAGLELKQEVQRNHGLVKIAEEVTYAHACGLGHRLGIGHGRRFDEGAVDGLRDREGLEVHALQRVAFRGAPAGR